MLKAVGTLASFRAFLGDERGTTSIEYGLIAILVSVSIITGLLAVQEQLIGWADAVVAALTTAAE